MEQVQRGKIIRRVRERETARVFRQIQDARLRARVEAWERAASRGGYIEWPDEPDDLPTICRHCGRAVK
ncbi:MAG: hypothetical protein EBR82_09805 [Caulobacteraceae bacterium]|nr:hypothetical protein [Caulobacteraceae bacterium]